LAELFPGSSPLRIVGLANTADRTVWEYVKANSFVSVSLDSDFAEMAALLERRPKSSGCAAAISQPS
jgi:predicted nuclease of predicted toxin-antitoxin system